MQDARYAPPQAEVQDIEPAGEGTALATRSQRLLAAIVDGLLATALTWLASKFTPWDPWTQPARGAWLSAALVNLSLGFAVFLLLHGVLLVSRGQTLGKAALGIRITRPDGSRASPARLLGLRYGLPYAVAVVPIAGAICVFIDSLLIFRSSRRCLHDVIAGTIVVKA